MSMLDPISIEAGLMALVFFIAGFFMLKEFHLSELFYKRQRIRLARHIMQIRENAPKPPEDEEED